MRAFGCKRKKKLKEWKGLERKIEKKSQTYRIYVYFKGSGKVIVLFYRRRQKKQ